MIPTGGGDTRIIYTSSVPGAPYDAGHQDEPPPGPFSHRQKPMGHTSASAAGVGAGGAGQGVAGGVGVGGGAGAGGNDPGIPAGASLYHTDGPDERL